MAPLTRFRATDDRVPTPLMKEYYGQRAAVPGTLIITEGTFISAAACGGFANAPGLWRKDQVAAWRSITDDVHSKGCFIFCQLFAMGRAGDLQTAAKDGFPIVAPSAIPMDLGGLTPQAMTIDEIQKTVQDFVVASKNAMQAGFDGVKIHGSNGYLLDQFLQDRTAPASLATWSNLSATPSVPQRVGLRLNPWSTFQGMRMADPIPQFTDVIARARCAGIAYLHLVESRIAGADDYEGHDQLDFAYELWEGPLLIAGGYTPQEAKALVDKRYPSKEILVLFGRLFIANPDLVYRIRQDLELDAYDRNTFYVAGSPRGYVDYTFSEGYLAEGRGRPH